VSQSGFQVTCPSRLRHAETRILAEEPRPATAALRTSRQGRVVIRRLVEGLIGQLRELAQRLREACHLGGRAVSTPCVGSRPQFFLSQFFPGRLPTQHAQVRVSFTVKDEIVKVPVAGSRLPLA
jgi:hypothetical protein